MYSCTIYLNNDSVLQINLFISSLPIILAAKCICFTKFCRLICFLLLPLLYFLAAKCICFTECCRLMFICLIIIRSTVSANWLSTAEKQMLRCGRHYKHPFIPDYHAKQRLRLCTIVGTLWPWCWCRLHSFIQRCTYTFRVRIFEDNCVFSSVVSFVMIHLIVLKSLIINDKSYFPLIFWQLS